MIAGGLIGKGNGNMTSTTRNLRQALGMAAFAALTLAGSLTPVRPRQSTKGAAL